MTTKSPYRPRIVDKQLRFKLSSKGAVLVEGPKWCGKTTTSEQVAKSILYLSDPTINREIIATAELDPTQLLTGATPRLFDEWQLVPKLWDSIRFEIDHRKKFGQFILTGSSTPADSTQIFHSGTGRFTWLKMRPMSLFESNDSTGEVSLENLFQGKSPSATNPSRDLEHLAFLACRGGWPAAIEQPTKVALEQSFDYLEATIRTDYSKIDGVERSPDRMQKIMRSYARLQGTQSSAETIALDLSKNEGYEIHRDTVSSYLNALKRTFVIEDSPAWNANLRSKTAVRTSDTLYFVDPSIATATLGISPAELSKDLHLFGFIFETLCIRDLRVYAEAKNAKVYHYRDSRGLECDAVIVLRSGDYGLVEIKLGGDTLIEEAAKNLTALSNDLASPPAFKMILTGTSPYAYQREDGIFVVPITTLKD